MNDPPTTDHAAQLREAFAAIERDHPYWHCWQGVIPCLVYARRVNSSPPRVVRAPDPARLREAIEADVARRGR